MKFQSAKLKFLNIDLKTCLYLNHFSHSAHIAVFFKVVSRLGDGTFWYLMLVAVWWMEGLAYSLQLSYLCASSLFGTLIYKFLKQRTTRPRPYQVHQVIRLGERPLDHFSFPSGHSLHAVMATTLLGYVQPVLLVLMLPFCLLVALSRMILGLHYPSDVAAGAIIGGLVATLILHLAGSVDIVL